MKKSPRRGARPHARGERRPGPRAPSWQVLRGVRGAEHEDAGVPEEAAGGEELRGPRARRDRRLPATNPLNTRRNLLFSSLFGLHVSIARLGARRRMPSVTNASSFAATAAPARSAARNAGSSATAWSEGSTTRTASASSAHAASAERAMAGAVLRRTGSRMKRASGISGSSFLRRPAWDARPETYTFPGPATAAARR